MSRERVAVTVDRGASDGISRLALGVTHTRYSLDTGGDAQAITQAKALLAACRYQNVHIMGWGTMNPNPAPGVYDWGSLDRRMALVRSMKATPVVTLCAAPDWMKGGRPGRTDWSKIEVAPLPEHYADFARLAATIARRYPDVRHFQVWNEMKGLWDARANNWNIVAYTRLYNRVFDALKSVNRAIHVGGPYFVVEGTGSNRGDWATEKPLRARQREILDYWLRHQRGADFLVLDKGLTDFHDKSAYTEAEQMTLTHHFGDVARQVRARTSSESGAGLPLWWAEFYGGNKGSDADFTAALHASILRHMLLGGSSVALLWQPMDTGEVSHALFSDVRKGSRVQPYPYYHVFQAFHRHFGPGTRLYKTACSTPDIEVLASAKKVLLINKRAAPVTIELAGRSMPLERYQVRLLDISPREMIGK